MGEIFLGMAIGCLFSLVWGYIVFETEIFFKKEEKQP